MDFLGGEIAKLKRQAPTTTGDKYIKRSEIEARRQEEYKRDQAERQAARSAREEEKQSRLIAHESSKRRKVDTAVPAKAITEDQSIDDLANKKELRELSQPIHLFGETDKERKYRLQQYKAHQEAKLNSTSADLKTVYEMPLDADLPNVGDLHIDSKDAAADDKRDGLSDALFVFFRILIRDWLTRVKMESEESSKTADTARKDLSKLLIRLKKNTLPNDVLKNLAIIATALRSKDYTLANSTYLLISIGKATWPVGVSMVGIHERALRVKHKAGKEDTAHILNDEGTRVWLQSLKRLITHYENQSG